MLNLEKFLKALGLVKVDNKFSMGLLILKTKKEIDWTVLKMDKKLIELKNKEKSEILREMVDGVKSDKWLILELNDNLQSEIYGQLKLLAMNNQMQLTDKNETIEIRQKEKTRIVAIADKQTIKKIENDYPDFRNLFGPVMEI